MESSFFQGRQFQVDSSSKYSSSVPSQTQIKKKSTKKLFSLNSSCNGVSSRKRIRRQYSIQQSVTNYFKQNKMKVASFLNINQQVIHLIHPCNLIFPQPFKIMEDGLYILIRGGIKMITFSDQKPPYRSMCKQIINNAFKMMRNNKDLGMKVLENGSVLYGKQLQKKNYYRNNSKGKNQVEHTVYTVSKAFSVIECVNENCLNLSTQTILYRIQEDDAKQFCFKQKKQEISSLMRKNNHLIRNHSMLHHSIEAKIYNFRNFVEFNNVAIIKRGTVKVTRKEKFNTEFIKQPIQYQKIVCQLGEGSVLVPQFSYQVASAQTEIIQIDLNDSFKMIRLPEWVSAFISQQQNYKPQSVQLIKSKNKIQKESLPMFKSQQQILGTKKPIVKKGKQTKKCKAKSVKQNQVSIQQSLFVASAKNTPTIPSLLTPLLTSPPSPSHFLKQKFLDFLPKNQKLRKIKFNFLNSKKLQVVNSVKLANQIVETQNQNSSGHKGQINNKKTKQKRFFKAMSPYIIISQKIGIKQMLQTQKILRKKPDTSQDGQYSKNGAKLQRLRSLEYRKNNRQGNQRKSWQGRSLNKMIQFLSKENQNQFQKQSKENYKKIVQSHKKSYSQMSTYYGDSVLNKCRQRGIFKQLSKLSFYKN